MEEKCSHRQQKGMWIIDCLKMFKMSELVGKFHHESYG